MKPRLRMDRNPMRPGKWRCVTVCVSQDGHQFDREGTGYTPQEAYRKWLRAPDGKPLWPAL